MSISVTLLCPSFATECAEVWLFIPMNTKMVSQTADTPEFFATARSSTLPDFVLPACLRVPLVSHFVLISGDWLESLVALPFGLLFLLPNLR